MRLQVRHLGCVPYEQGIEIQRHTAEARGAGDIPDTLLLLEHPAVITLGRGADRSHVKASLDDLERMGIAVSETNRGGDVTYHGPGQLVGYPIFDLRAHPHRPDLHRYLRQLEEALIRVLGEFGIVAGRLEGLTGVWTGLEDERPAKIAAIGIRVSRWVTQHGFALNVSPDMSHFDTIVPCGIRDYGVTSLARVLGRDIAVADVVPAVIGSVSAVFELDLDPAPPR